jgi:hypothetical protein
VLFFKSSKEILKKAANGCLQNSKATRADAQVAFDIGVAETRLPGFTIEKRWNRAF